MMHVQKKCVLTATLAIVLVLYMSRPHNNSVITQFYYFLYPEAGIQCYNVKSETLPDITEKSLNPERRSIFFHETSCNSYFRGKITITARQACAVESAARLNPSFDIHLLYASPGIFKFEGSESDRLLQALLSYTNVDIHHIDLEKYTRGTPVEGLYREGTLEGSGYAQSHASDVLRYLTLWKYGGIYLDLDVVVVKSLQDLPLNFAGSESARNVAAGVLSFSPNGLGQELAEACLQDLGANFKGDDWGYNGPGVITRLLQRICGVAHAKDMLNQECQGFKVFPTDSFYPVPWWNWTMYFDENATNDVLKMAQFSFIIHVWNKHSALQKIPIGNKKIPYIYFAQQFCPKIFEQCDEFF